MNERIIQFRVGVVVIGGLLVAGMLVVLFGEWPSVVGGRYTVNIVFAEAPGVTRDTPVRKSGILIGRVASVSFTDEGKVLVIAQIDNNVVVRQDEVFRVRPLEVGEQRLAPADFF